MDVFSCKEDQGIRFWGGKESHWRSITDVCGVLELLGEKEVQINSVVSVVSLQPARACVCLRDAAGLVVTVVINARKFAVKFTFTHIVMELILISSFPTQRILSDDITGVESKRNSKESNLHSTGMSHSTKGERFGPCFVFSHHQWTGWGLDCKCPPSQESTLCFSAISPFYPDEWLMQSWKVQCRWSQMPSMRL